MSARESESRYRALVFEEQPYADIADCLNEYGFVVTSGESVHTANRQFNHRGSGRRPHILIIDPLEVPNAKNLIAKAKEGGVPIIAITKKESLTSDLSVSWLNDFAEDVISIPYNPRELEARVKNILLSIPNHSYADSFRFSSLNNDISFNFQDKLVTTLDRSVYLTSLENKLLSLLSSRPEIGVHKKHLCCTLWPNLEHEKALDRLYTAKSRLSKKLCEVGLIVKNNKDFYVISQ